MDKKLKQLAAGYDEKYRREQYFQYRRWLYRPFVRAILKHVRLKRFDRILDVGCGQGFFSGLFDELGLLPSGVDVSAEAVRSAWQNHTGEFFQADGLALDIRPQDAVFVHGFSGYNSRNFASDRTTTDKLLAYLKPGGVLIFAHPTRFNPRTKAGEWVLHSIEDARTHFSTYPGAEVCFTLRVETLFLGKWAFRLPLTPLTAFISLHTRLGGELIAFVRRGGHPV